MIDPKDTVEECRVAFFATRNPLYVWGALHALLKPIWEARPGYFVPEPAAEYAEQPEAREMQESLPEWIADYLWQVARDLGDLAAGRDLAAKPDQATIGRSPEALHEWLRTEADWPKGAAPDKRELWRLLGFRFNGTQNPFVEFRKDLRARDAEFAARVEDKFGASGAPVQHAMAKVGAKHPTQWKRDLKPRAKRLRGDDS